MLVNTYRTSILFSSIEDTGTMTRSWLDDIPPEIRNDIYTKIFQTTPVNVHLTLQDKQPWPPCWDPAKKTCISLLLVSRAVYAEAKQLFLDETPFHFGRRQCVCLFHISKDQTARLPFIRHLSVTDRPYWTRFDRIMQTSWRDGHKLHSLTLNRRWGLCQSSEHSPGKPTRHCIAAADPDRTYLAE